MVTTPEIIDKVHDIILDDPKILHEHVNIEYEKADCRYGVTFVTKNVNVFAISSIVYVCLNEIRLIFWIE